MDHQSKICILGGGFGGLYTALYLAKSKEVINGNWQIVLVEPKDNFLFTPLLYEIITDELQRWEIAPTYQKLILGSNIQWQQQQVQNVSLEKKEVILEDNSLLSYDYLVLAMGRKTKFANIPGLPENALTFRSITDAQLVKNRLKLLLDSGQQQPSIAIVGAGANGVELACKTYDFLQEGKAKPKIYLIDRGESILKSFGRGVVRAGNNAIDRRGIKLLLSTEVQEIATDKIAVKQEDNIQTYPVDLVFWTGGTTAHSFIKKMPCRKNKWGQLLTRPTLQLVEYPDVLALGDMAEIRNSKTSIVPTTAQSAFQQASTAAKNLRAMVKKKSLKRFYYLHLGDMLTLGKGEAIVSSFGINLTGKLAGLIRRLIYVQRLPTMKHRLQVFKKLLFGGVK